MLYNISCSLVVRRGFVPPIKRDQQDEGGSNFGDELRSRVLYGAKGSSSKGSSRDHQLPPELEGDERLKNIEPRMVELITNEVRSSMYFFLHLLFSMETKVMNSHVIHKILCKKYLHNNISFASNVCCFKNSSSLAQDKMRIM